jgi:hypothetical protein|tara:strand:- start:259 stop:387 length:129 start_codon:yes stop_codon:yes gene_type:complete
MVIKEKCNTTMREIDAMLDRWIHNSIVRKQLRDLIIKAINEK